MTWRPGYALLALGLLLIEVAIALWVRDRLVRPYGGDVLALVLVYAGLRAVLAMGWRPALASALGIAVAVELAQGAGLLALIGVARASVAGVVLGHDFDLLDFAAYALGGMGVAAVERWHRA